MATYDEVWADETILLSNDGYVLEIFGFTDAHRYHLAMYRPQVEITERKRTIRVAIKATRGGVAFDCDPGRVDDVRAFGTRLAAAVALAITRTPAP